MTATTTKPTADRGCWWQIKLEELPNGLAIGYIGLRVGRAKDFYKVVQVRHDDMERVIEVSKELRDGSFQEPYTVRIPASPTATPVCSCPGWRHGGKCRHTGSLKALLSRDVA